MQFGKPRELITRRLRSQNDLSVLRRDEDREKKEPLHISNTFQMFAAAAGLGWQQSVRRRDSRLYRTVQLVLLLGGRVFKILVKTDEGSNWQRQ